jgi:large subunit ribosomal protein L30
MVRIVLKRGYIGVPDKQKKVLEALGLKKIGSAVNKEDNDATKGMIRKVSHLITIEKVEK